MPRQRTRTDVAPCSELMPMKQANTISAFNRNYSNHFGIKNYQFFYAFLSLRAQAFSSGTLSVEEFVATIATIKETEESRMKFMLLRERSSLKHEFTLVAMISFFCSKRYFAKDSF